MAAVLLIFVLSFIVGGAAWLTLGPRFNIKNDVQQNDLLNFLSYVLIALPWIFVIVFYVLESF
ncbi:MAG: hypothetical protein O7F71_19670 [Gammaproteobacteria bacterium]|nr:hypothetical protein [Gammaproteobacteria bacterium]